MRVLGTRTSAQAARPRFQTGTARVRMRASLPPTAPTLLPAAPGRLREQSCPARTAEPGCGIDHSLDGPFRVVNHPVTKSPVSGNRDGAIHPQNVVPAQRLFRAVEQLRVGAT